MDTHSRLLQLMAERGWTACCLFGLQENLNNSFRKKVEFAVLF